MSHELRTPLNAIIGFSEVMESGQSGELSPRQCAYCHDIRDGGMHLLSLINDILDLSKIEAGKMTLEAETVCFPPLLEGCLAIVREKALAHGISLALGAGAGPDTAQVDVRKFKQMIFNLLANAIKFTPDGGSVRLEARKECGGWLAVSVSDTGIGIAAADLPRLFKPFEQLDGSRSRRHEGTGLGLSMVKRLAELHGGGVAVRSEPGQGSTFTVRIPQGGNQGN
jgi:signal transduction histidine kinase